MNNELFDFFDLEKVSAYLDAKGDLHDCVVDVISLQEQEKVFQMKIIDIDANLAGLPGYEGPRPCIMKVEGISSLNFTLSFGDKYFRIYEATVSNNGNENNLKISFSPAGTLELCFCEMNFLQPS